MICPKCGSENVTVSVTTELVQKKKKHGVLYWVFFGWLIDLLLWIFLTIPKLIIRAIKKNKVESKTITYAVCQDCGNRWEVN